MEHIITVKVESDRSISELVNEIQANLEYEGFTAKTIVASNAVRRVVLEGSKKR